MSNTTYNLIVLGSSLSLIRNSYSSTSNYPLTICTFLFSLANYRNAASSAFTAGLPSSLVVIILIFHFIENISHNSNFLGSVQFSSISGEKIIGATRTIVIWANQKRGIFNFFTDWFLPFPCWEWIWLSWALSSRKLWFLCARDSGRGLHCGSPQDERGGGAEVQEQPEQRHGVHLHWGKHSHWLRCGEPGPGHGHLLGEEERPPHPHHRHHHLHCG